MSSLRAAVIGGGPAGLYAARLLKRRHPAWDVTLFEAQPPDATFGFGVALHPHALRRLEGADPESVEAITSHGQTLGTWTLRRGSDELRVANDHGVGVSRRELLKQLAEQAQTAGVQIETGRPVVVTEVADADIVVGADGVHSATREHLASELGVTLEQGPLAYIWCGAELPLDGMLLSLAPTQHGVLTAHVMPYGQGRCTFQVDGDIETVKRHGLVDSTDNASLSSGTDEQTLEMLERTFADVLDGARIRANRSRWATFTTVACDRWSHGNVVLLGDAAHTAHYTVGSGTRIAMEDAAALADALDGAGSLSDAFLEYERVRRPSVARLQWRAARSQTWWSSLGARIDLPLPQLLLSYLSRTGATRLEQLVARNPDLVAACIRVFGGVGTAGRGLADRILSLPFRRNAHAVTSRVIDRRMLSGTASVVTLPVEGVHPWSTESEHLVAHARHLSGKGISMIRLVGARERPALLDRLDVAEQLRLTVGVSTIVSGPSLARDDLALGLLAGRTDLVEVA